VRGERDDAFGRSLEADFLAGVILDDQIGLRE
jgi:hypothetical protein